MIIDWKKASQELLLEVESEMADFFDTNKKNPLPTLAVILVGNNPASLAYIKMKKKRAEQVGMNFFLKKLDNNITQEELENEVKKLSQEKNISGIIVQMPLPQHIDSDKIIDCIPEEKDVDGFTKSQIGNMFLGKKWLYSCTPKGILTLLQSNNIDIVWKNIAVIGRSNIVGKPMSLLLLNAGATVTTCHSKTKNISEITQKSDIIIVAVGKPKFLTKDMVSENSIIIDVGSNLDENGKFCGDADFENLENFVQAISPSPGGVGPMTVATLIQNTWEAYKIQHSL